MPSRRSEGACSPGSEDELKAENPDDEGVSTNFSALVLRAAHPRQSTENYFRGAPLRLYQGYEEYERSVHLRRSEQSVKLPLLSVSQFLRKNVCPCLSRIFFPGTGELSGADLREALAQHVESWTGDAKAPKIKNEHTSS